MGTVVVLQSSLRHSGLLDKEWEGWALPVLSRTGPVLRLKVSQDG